MVSPHVAAAEWLLILALGASISPWLWISVRGAGASAWGSPAIDDESAQLTRQLSETFNGHLQGRRVWLIVLGVLVLLLLLLLECISVAPEYFLTVTLSYTLCWTTSALLLLFAWRRVGKEANVQPGLLVIFFLSGGLLGVLFALVLEATEVFAWKTISPACNLTRIPMTAECNGLAATMWVLTPGLAEETGKAIWLFFRLRRATKDLPADCCCHICPASRHNDCGCWYKLASTPYHVVLCALAAGAGFECLENIKYVFLNTNALTSLEKPESRELLLLTAVVRLATSGLHMVWTGLIGFGLARRLFLKESRRPSMFAVLMPSVLLHGLFDYSISALSQVPASKKSGLIDKSEAADLIITFALLFVAVVLGSCCLLACLTGLRCCDRDQRSCCCAPGFFDRFLQDQPALAREPLLSPPPFAVAAATREPLLLPDPASPQLLRQV